MDMVFPDDRPLAGGTPGLELRLLGPVQAARDGREVRLGGPKQRTVLALLLLDAGQLVPAGRLVHQVWRAAHRQGRPRHCGHICPGCGRFFPPRRSSPPAAAAMPSASAPPSWTHPGLSGWPLPGRPHSAVVRQPPQLATSGKRSRCGAGLRWPMSAT